DGFGVAVEQLEQQVPSQSVQSSVPPLSDPAIYRTSPATPLRTSRRVLATKKFFATDKICFTVWSAPPHCKKKTHLRMVFGQPSSAEWSRRARCSGDGVRAQREREGLGRGRVERPLPNKTGEAVALPSRQLAPASGGGPRS